MGAVFGFSNVDVYFTSEIILAREERARLSPPRWWVVAIKPSSDMVGTEKSPFGPAIFS